MKNLDLWNEVSKTDPLYTKKFSQGFSGTSINATWLVMRATEQWGMIGLGWGYEVTDERIDVGGDVYNKDGEVIGQTKTHTIKLKLWVKSGDEIGSVEHFGHTPYVYYSQNKDYWITDQEAPKKSLTDALKKCLSMHGFSADIFLGLYDDRNYLEEVKAQSAIDHADNKEDEILKQKHEYTELLAKNLKLIDEAVNVNMLEGVYKSIIRKAKRQNDEAGILTITKATAEAKERLKEKGDKS